MRCAGRLDKGSSIPFPFQGRQSLEGFVNPQRMIGQMAEGGPVGGPRTVHDATGDGFTGTLSGGVSFTTAGYRNEGLNFNGTSGSVRLGNPAIARVEPIPDWALTR